MVGQAQQRLGDALRQQRLLVLDAGDVGRGSQGEEGGGEEVVR